ncbi:MAG: DUF4834 family protein [Prevotella sp.]|nr:DUF4834 family protein [Prevotella sp.]
MDMFLGIFIGLVVFFTITLLVFFYFLRKGLRFVNRLANGEMTDEEFERLSRKNYRKKEGPSFDKDYFRGASQQQKEQFNQRRTTRTADGVTIVDKRDPNKANKKIFAQDEGEYVDFTE